MLTLDDFVMLGKTVPEPNSDGRVFVCSAGYSATLRSLVRIYPLSRYAAPPSWSVSTVKLERNPRDSRFESYQLAADRRPTVHDHINRAAFEVTGTVPPAERQSLLRSCVFPSIQEANQRPTGYGNDRLSLAIIHGEAYELEFEHNPASPDSPQLALFDLPDMAVPEFGARRFPYVPKLRFRDAGGEHRLSLREWGTFNLIRKNGNLTQMSEGERRRFVRNALPGRLSAASSVLVGNQANIRTSWLAIAVLNGLREAQLPLDELMTEAVAA